MVSKSERVRELKFANALESLADQGKEGREYGVTVTLTTLEDREEFIGVW